MSNSQIAAVKAPCERVKEKDALSLAGSSEHLAVPAELNVEDPAGRTHADLLSAELPIAFVVLNIVERVLGMLKMRPKRTVPADSL